VISCIEAKDTPSTLFKNHSWIGGWLVRKYIKNRLKAGEKEENLLYDFFTGIFKLKDSSEVAIHYILKPPRARPYLPLEKFITDDLKDLDVLCYYGDHDWMDSSGALRISQGKQKKNFKLSWIENCGH